MTPLVRRLACFALLAVALVAALAAPQAASAAKKKPACWQRLLTDWYDGRIDNTYPLACYQQALNHLPPDVDTYSSARDDIRRALANAAAEHKSAVPPGAGKRDGDGGGAPPAPTKTTSGATTVPRTTTGKTSSGPIGTDSSTSGGRRNDNGPIGDALGSASSSPDSVPLPLIILGALAVLLVGAGVAGMVVRRIQTRRLGS